MKVFNRRDQKDLRKKLRQDSTIAERQLWNHLKSSKLGYRFRRQHGIGRYIVDFYCPAKKLIVEIDGDSHFEQSAQNLDDIRTQYFNKNSIKVIRFTNQDIYFDLENVLSEIRSYLE
ncbi:endonuclease domain-containing protein [Candidatus Uhrbacteria bacterium]|jgi:very-short-patch-repair endonuclease|nr:endonuclease domain-containing protein [Candidatus Uhrbacteria bacterium]MBT7717316.1 endonuclease domain-containing protein [Candidatus Uhrbacteria bacterium]